MYYVYMLRCSDNSIYTGITTDIKRRFEEHLNQDKKGAKYTKSHYVLKLEVVFKTENKVNASKLEYRIKHLKKKEKEDIITAKRLDIIDNLSLKLDLDEYSLYEIIKCDL